MNSFDATQLATLTSYFRVGTSDASRALSTWLGRDVQVSMEQLEQVSLEFATEQLGPSEETVCACCMRVSGGVSGQLLLGFDDASGLMLCDTLLTRKNRSTDWGELEISAAMETTNIVGCAFLNSLASVFPKSTSDRGLSQNPIDSTWIPTPPVFVRDYAAAIMQFALMDQACEFDSVLVAQTQFAIEKMPIGWRLLLIPDAEVLQRLARILR
ncbi:MAG: chemotaxis protein CheC [Planctomycetota bacterium]|nr:chemotaxis protein CheC [Planctomycetota bacterium]